MKKCFEAKFMKSLYKLGIFTRESYSPEQSTHIILKADFTPSLRVLLKVVFIIILLIQ
jgi:hypothetical protein